jgi:hypothetical protein
MRLALAAGDKVMAGAFGVTGGEHGSLLESAQNRQDGSERGKVLPRYRLMVCEL